MVKLNWNWNFRFYPRWREWEVQQALELDYTLDETQLSEDWAGMGLERHPFSLYSKLQAFNL